METSDKHSIGYLSEIDQLAGNHLVALIGDSCTDQTIFLHPQKLSTEAPIPIYKRDPYEDKLSSGMVWNVAANIKDLSGQYNLWSGEGNSTKKRFYSGGHQVLRIDDDRMSRKYLSRENVEELLVGLGALEADCITLVDYAKGTITPLLMKHVKHLAHTTSTPLMLRAKVIPDSMDEEEMFNFYGYLDYILLNFESACFLAGTRPERVKLDQVDSASLLAKEITTRYDIKNVFITLGAEGILHHEKYKEPVWTPQTGLVELADTSGVADTVTAVVALGVAARLPSSVISVFANNAAEVVLRKPRIATCDIGELSNKFTFT